MTKKTLNDEMVILAREYRGLTQEQLARSLSVSQATVARIEGGTYGEVSDKMAERLSRALQFPADFFYQPEERLGFGSSAFFYRKREKISAVDRKRISGVVNLMRITIRQLLNAVELAPSRELPNLEIEEYEGDAANVARAVRGLWNLPDGPIKDMTRLVESAGVIVVPCDFGTRFMDATSLRLTEMPPLIFINKDLDGDRWRFTVAHEMAHLIMHETPRETMEDEADRFAAEFLMPEADISAQFSRLPKIRLQDLANLKQFWKVSMQALLMRAGHLGYLSDNQKKHLWSQISRLGYRLKEPNQIPKEETQNYQNLFQYYRKDLGINSSEMARMSFIHHQEFESLHALGVRPSSHFLRVVQ